MIYKTLIFFQNRGNEETFRSVTEEAESAL